jgi:hypothetical protein
LLCATVVFAAACQHGAGSREQMSPQMAWVVRQRRVNQFEMNLSGLSPAPAEQMSRIRSEADEVYYLPARKHAQDDFHYQVLLDTKHNRFWIIRSGGIAGSEKGFGPGELNPNANY